jgi:hypothetical protein
MKSSAQDAITARIVSEPATWTEPEWPGAAPGVVAK